MLALVAYTRPNLLLLDEPTNHLDLEMRQALAVALQDYAGAVVLVSHDRHLLRTVADEFRIVHHGRAMPFDGDLEDYADWLAQTGSGQAAQGQPAPPVAPTADSRKQRKREDAERRNRLSPLRAQVARCEADLERLARETTSLQEQLATPELYSEPAKEKLRALLQSQASLQRETHKTEAAWLEASERLENEMRQLNFD